MAHRYLARLVFHGYLFVTSYQYYRQQRSVLVYMYIYIGYRYGYLLRVSAVSVFAWAPPFIVRRYDRGIKRRTRTPYVTVCDTTELPIGGQRTISTIRSLDVDITSYVFRAATAAHPNRDGGFGDFERAAPSAGIHYGL